MGDLFIKPQSSAFFSVERTRQPHGIGLPFQRRWLNHRNSVTNPAECFPQPAAILAHSKHYVRFLVKQKIMSLEKVLTNRNSKLEAQNRSVACPNKKDPGLKLQVNRLSLTRTDQHQIRQLESPVYSGVKVRSLRLNPSARSGLAENSAASTNRGWIRLKPANSPGFVTRVPTNFSSAGT